MLEGKKKELACARVVIGCMSVLLLELQHIILDADCSLLLRASPAFIHLAMATSRVSQRD